MVALHCVQNPAIADIYTEHSVQTTVAKYSPSGFYIASAGNSVTLLHCICCHLQCFNTIGWAAGRASGLLKNWVMKCWYGYLSGPRCNWCAYGPFNASATPSSLLLH